MAAKKFGRNLVIVLGDQLNHDSAAFDDFDPDCDQVWMAETQEEATHVWCHQYRLVAFFAAMRHFRDELQADGKSVLYHELTADKRKGRGSSFQSVLRESLTRKTFERLVLVQPGDARVCESLSACAVDLGIEMEQREDRSFYCRLDRFDAWVSGRKSLVLEQFYRLMRKEHDVLVEPDGKPTGGSWNYDSENRGTFGKQGPGTVPLPPSFKPDRVTRDVMTMVSKRFSDHPGGVDAFDLPVNRSQALVALDDFVTNRLTRFGDFQDAMWKDERFLYHSRLSHSLNLHLLNPREVVDSAVAAYREGTVPLNAVEGFVRQVLGWREYVRGIYWWKMPEYGELNALNCSPDQDVPSFFWDGKTDMVCVADAMRLLIDTAYAHHIQRLMVLGLYAQLIGVHPKKFNDWHLAMYADAIDWVSMPNTLGMSQYADGGIMATKPYCASGNYIRRMSNLCKTCRYKPEQSIGPEACPFTTLYWDFLDRHREQFAGNRRMLMQLKNLDRKSDADMAQIRTQAASIRSGQTKV